MRIRILALLALAALGNACSCSSAEDQAAKARIFSPEDPPQVLLAAREEIETDDLDGDPELADRVLAISAQEAVARIGPHVQKAKVTFKWSMGEKEVDLAEERMVALRPNGDFHVLIDNDERQGMEWVKVAGVSYARSRYAKFRERRRDRGSSFHVVDSAYRTLATFDQLVQRAVKLEEEGTAQVAGRQAVKYAVKLGEVREDEAAKALPPIEFPKGGPDKDTELRRAVLEKGKPTKIAGTLFVDEKTGVPLKADLQAVIAVDQAKLDLSVLLDVSGVGKDPAIAVPEHIEDAPRPPGVVATLEAYGIPRKNAEEEKAKEGETPAPADGE